MNNIKKFINMKGITKFFSRICALEDVDFFVNGGETVGLLGDNGAGKSTLIKILSGIFPPSKGEIFIAGNKVNLKSPRDSINYGIETVYQDQALVDETTIEDNIFLGREPSRIMGFINKNIMQVESEKLLKEVGLNIISTKTLIKMLSGGQRQGVSIGRAMYFNAKIVILDEPTAALSIKETHMVLDFVKKLQQKGIACIFISHNMYHVFPLADRYVVLGRGKKIADVKREEASIKKLTELIIS